MIDSIPALSTNVIATVRRDHVAVANGNSSGQADTTQAKTAYIPQPAPISAEAAGNLNDLNEQIAQILTRADSAAGIEPEEHSSTAYGRASAAYRLVNGFDTPRGVPSLSLTA